LKNPAAVFIEILLHSSYLETFSKFPAKVEACVDSGLWRSSLILYIIIHIQRNYNMVIARVQFSFTVDLVFTIALAIAIGMIVIVANTQKIAREYSIWTTCICG
jgi:hypothetical protein